MIIKLFSQLLKLLIIRCKDLYTLCPMYIIESDISQKRNSAY